MTLFWQLFIPAMCGILVFTTFLKITSLISDRKFAKVSQAHDEQNRLAYRNKQDKRIDKLERQILELQDKVL